MQSEATSHYYNLNRLNYYAREARQRVYLNYS